MLICTSVTRAAEGREQQGTASLWALADCSSKCCRQTEQRGQEYGSKTQPSTSPWSGSGEAAAFLPDSPGFLLTVRVALAELLTEILSHDAGAGAVAGVLGVVTGLVVVHLGRRVICKKRNAQIRSCTGQKRLKAAAPGLPVCLQRAGSPAAPSSTQLPQTPVCSAPNSPFPSCTPNLSLPRCCPTLYEQPQREHGHGGSSPSMATAGPARSTPRSPSTGSCLPPALPRWPGWKAGHGHPAAELGPTGERPRKPRAAQPRQTHLSSAGSSCSALPTAWKGSREGLRGRARLRDGAAPAGDSTGLSGSVRH